ncbi:MAG: type III-B CRISPR module RAMP protein Cmr4 [Deltaproteobacteria bacterium]|nr:type III-B CRISPR module RAMP protein Cmr4 [Deltaproteobacteria bacterium]
MNTRLLFIHAFSPLHAGTGQSVGAIDLAIAREKSTGVPYLPGSSIKGVLRDRFRHIEGVDKPMRHNLFGPDTENASDHAGSVHFGDGRLVFLPVRSLAGTFAYVTSRYLLDRLVIDIQESGLKLDVPDVAPAGSEDVVVAEGSTLVHNTKVILEELDLLARPNAPLKSFAQTLGKHLGGDALAKSLASRICVVPDDVMSFLLDHATEVTARIRLDANTKTVAKGALWYEESLPAETILAALVVATPPKFTKLDAKTALKTVGDHLDGLIQFGGKATVGRGFCRVSMLGGDA